MKKLFRKSQGSPAPVPIQKIVHPSDSVFPTSLPPKYTIPAIPHPCHHKLSVLVTKEGLLLRPIVDGVNSVGAHLRLGWGKHVQLEELHGDGDGEGTDWTQAAVIFGILGTMQLFSESCLFVITARKAVGHLLSQSHSVYEIKSVASIPLEETRARTAVDAIVARNREQNQSIHTTVHDDSPDDLRDNAPPTDAITSPPNSESVQQKVTFSDQSDIRVLSPAAVSSFNSSSRPLFPAMSGASTPLMEPDTPPPTVAKALAARLTFWNRLSHRQPSVAEEEPLHGSDDDSEDDHTEGLEDPDDVIKQIVESAPQPSTIEQKHSELDSKISKECIKLFGKGGMYLSYNFDITTSLQHKQQQLAGTRSRPPDFKSSGNISQPDEVDVTVEPNTNLPLWRRVDKQFWWNEWMLQPFIEAGLHPYVLPVMQGFYQIAAFHLPREPTDTLEESENILIDYIIISRRSRDRAGLRYQRRGIDDDANVANFVETESIMRVDRQGTLNVFSYVQIRGSIPLFWTQSGYSLKPPPVLSSDRTHEQNLSAIRRHFKKTLPLYGPHTLVNLAEQHGKEGAITRAYEKYANELAWKDVHYTGYDFHAETKGMKYENIAKLIDEMDRIFETQGFLWVCGTTALSEQKGVFRVNCIDCLDRTNVFQSAFGRHVLATQLSAVALLNRDIGRTEVDIIFNDLWANNGDAISRAYAGTSALKGDFTRTGKRDIGGILNDGMNSLARMYASTFSDWFSQAVIDFTVGHRALSVFSEFLLKLQTTDPRERIRISNIRADAIATSVSRVLSEGERLLSGWTLFSPMNLNTKIGDKFEEKVVLLSADALYVISYDYTLEKVAKYDRLPLGNILGIMKGAYILSTLEEGSRDVLQNYGFVVNFLNSGQTTRVTSYSFRNSADFPDELQSIPDRGSPSTSASRGSRPKPVRSKSRLSQMISGSRSVGDQLSSYVAFKSLPVDPMHMRRAKEGFEELSIGSDDLSRAETCKDAVNVIVDAIVRACADVGNSNPSIVTESEIVSLAEAQRMTTVYAKMEYGLKRLLWLGG
ncbi:hypothetical protein BD410DRAFT_718891 [Rickenella mellea]|uniref:SAC domain-containing protein n=1 Tax=Rickenella mellea TaxID=50990 RepID=A0A4Y7QC92_9AGAM|nr:hypothetical protein BD410DRAFT_718891 [Rickenella mellea]